MNFSSKCGHHMTKDYGDLNAEVKDKVMKKKGVNVNS